MKNQLIVLTAMLFSAYLQAQQTGEVDYESLGIRFEIPAGWMGQQAGEYFIMGSNTVPGMITMHQHDAKDLTALRNLLEQGISADAGTFLKIENSTQQINTDALASTFVGTLEYKQAKAYVLGKLNIHGDGIMVAAITTPEAFSQQHINLVQEINQSIHFSKPKMTQQAKYFDQWVRGNRLVYMDNYYSGSTATSSIAGGYSINKHIDLCNNGYFRAYSSALAGVGGDNAHGYSADRSKGEGTWKIVGYPGGSTQLILNFSDNSSMEFELSEQEGKLMVDDSRYYLDDARCQ